MNRLAGLAVRGTLALLLALAAPLAAQGNAPVWEAYCAKLAPEASASLLKNVGLASDDPDIRAAFFRSLDRTEVRPDESFAELPADGQAAALRGGIQAYAQTLLTKDPGTERLDDFHSELMDMRRAALALDQKTAIGILDRLDEIHAARSREMAAAARLKIDKLKEERKSGVIGDEEYWDGVHAAGAAIAATVLRPIDRGFDFPLAQQSRLIAELEPSGLIAWIDRPWARAVLRRRARQTQERRMRLAATGAGYASSVAAANPDGAAAPLVRAALGQLSSYVPGADPTHISWHNGSLSLAGEQGWTRFAVPHSIVAVRRDLGPIDAIHAVVHEAVHQANEKSLDMTHALLLEGADFKLLAALNEGFIDLRARELLLELLKEGWNGGAGLAAEFARRVRRRFRARDLSEAAAALKQRWFDHPYQPFVAFVEDLVAPPGSRDALEAAFKKGHIRQLLERSGGIAALRARLDHAVWEREAKLRERQARQGQIWLGLLKRFWDWNMSFMHLWTGVTLALLMGCLGYLAVFGWPASLPYEPGWLAFYVIYKWIWMIAHYWHLARRLRGDLSSFFPSGAPQQ